MIYRYYVKFDTGLDWVTLRVFTYKEEGKALECANYLCKYLHIRVYKNDKIIYECKEEK